MKNVGDAMYEREQLEFEVDALLRRLGWKHTSENPIHLWLWEKALPDGRVLLVDKSTALSFAQADWVASCICTDESNDHQDDCPAKGDS